MVASKDSSASRISATCKLKHSAHVKLQKSFSVWMGADFQNWMVTDQLRKVTNSTRESKTLGRVWCNHVFKCITQAMFCTKQRQINIKRLKPGYFWLNSTGYVLMYIVHHKLKFHFHVNSASFYLVTIGWNSNRYQVKVGLEPLSIMGKWHIQ